MFQNSSLIAGQARFPIVGDRIHKLGTDCGAMTGSLFKLEMVWPKHRI